jgi:hypothetical protein
VTSNASSDAAARTGVPAVGSWDPTLPVLAALLARREELGAGSVQVMPDGTTYFNVWGTTMGPDGVGLAAAGVQKREWVPVDDLLAEQVPPEEQMLAALAGVPMEFTVSVNTRVQGMVQSPVPEEGRVVDLRVQVAWNGAFRLYIHMPLVSG